MYLQCLNFCVGSESLNPQNFVNPAVFLLHYAMHKRGLCCCAVSIRLSVTFVYSIKMNKLIFKFFSPSGSHSILVFPYQYSDGDPPNGDIECRLG